MKLAEAYVEVKTNQKVFSKELKTMETSVNTSTGRMQKKFQALGPTFRKVGIGMAAVGAGIVAAGVLSIKTYSKMGDEVAKMAKRTGFSTEALSELRHASEISGASLGALEKGVKRMSGTILDAEDGLETYIRSFRHIGIEVEELKGLKPEEQFMKLASAIAEVEDPTKRAAIAQDIFGRAGTELLPLFAEGAEGIAKLRQEAHDLGIVFSEEAAKKAEEMTDAMHRVGEATSGLKIAVADALIPVLMPLVDRVKEIITGMKDWMKAHPGLTSALAKVGVVLGPLLIALGGLLVILPSLVAIAPAVGAAFHIMLGPIGLITAAIAAAVAIFLYFYKTSDKFRNFVDNIVAYIKAFVQNAWNRLVWLKDNWGALWKTIFEGLPKIAKNAFDNLITIFKWIWDFIKGWGSWLGENFLNVWRNMFGAIATAVKTFGENIWAQLKWVGEKMKPQNWFKKIEKPEWKPLLGEFEAVWAELPVIAELQLKKLTTGVENFMKPLPALVKPVLKTIKEGAEETGKAIDGITTATEKYITTYDALLKLRGKDKELTEEEKKRIKELEEVQKAAQKEIAAIRATSFEEWKANNEARTKELFDELAVQKQIEKDAKDEIAAIRAMTFEEWQKKNEARTKELYDELATQKQIEQDAKDEIAAIRQGGFEDWKKENDAKVKEHEDRLAKAKKQQKDAEKEIKKIGVTSFKDWKKNNDARIKEWEEGLAKKKKGKKDAEREIKGIRAESFEDWQKKNTARTEELYAELATQKQIEQDAKDEIANIRKLSFEEWKANNEARTKELFDDLATQKQIQQDAKDEIADIRKMSFEEWKEQNEARTEELYDELADQKRIQQNAKDEIKKIEDMSFEEWKANNEKRTEELYEELAKQRSVWERFVEAVGAMWERMGDAAKEHFSKLENYLGDVLNALADVISGTKSLGEALLDLAYSIPVIGGIVEGIVNLATAIWDWATGAAAAKRDMNEMLNAIAITTGLVSEAFKDMGMSLTGSIENAERAIRGLIQTQEDLELSTRDKLVQELDKYYDYRVLKVMDLDELLALSAETRLKLEQGTLEEIAETEEETAERTKDAKVGTLAAIEEAYAKESAMIDKKIKLIEIEIKLLMAAALAEQGKIKEAQKLREEAHDSLQLLLKDIEEVGKATKDTTEEAKKYGKEGKRSADDMRDALGRTRREIENLDSSTDDARIGIEQWGEEGRKSTDKLVIGFEEVEKASEGLRTDIDKIPELVDFDIIGNLTMPFIPDIETRYFDIIGRYQDGGGGTPPLNLSKIKQAWIDYSTPLWQRAGRSGEWIAQNIIDEWATNQADIIRRFKSAQIGIPYIPRTEPYVVHKEEAILNPPQAREWRAGRGGVGGGDINFHWGSVQMKVQNLHTKADKEELVGLVEDTMTKVITKKMGRP